MPEKRTVSEERVWMKHYPREALESAPPKCKIYTFLKDSNKDRLRDTAIYYYGTRISVARLIEKIDECADAFAALGKHLEEGHLIGEAAGGDGEDGAQKEQEHHIHAGDGTDED